MVAEAGLEPARPNGHRILNPERLPIPPLGPFQLAYSKRYLTVTRSCLQE